MYKKWYNTETQVLNRVDRFVVWPVYSYIVSYHAIDEKYLSAAGESLLVRRTFEKNMSFVVNNFSLNDCNSGYAGNKKKQNKILSEDCYASLAFSRAFHF